MKFSRFLLSLLMCVSLFINIAHCVVREYWPTKEWKISPPEKQGLDSDIFGNIGPYVKETFPNTWSLLIIRHGYIVYEEYYKGDKEDLNPLMSAAKSVISILIGIALKEGYLKSVDQKMIDFLPELASKDLDLQIKKVTLRHLLTMSSGCVLTSLNPQMMKLAYSSTNEPGRDFNYNQTDPQILSMIITKVTKMKALNFGKKYLFKPLGIKNLRWDEVYGYTMGSVGLQLTSRDMAKIGYLFLNNGSWDKKQVVTPEWVAESTSVQMGVQDEKWDYGYLWWVSERGGFHVYMVWGSGAKHIFVVPDLDIVMVTTASRDEDYAEIIEKFIVPAIR
jgi:CubicO group peptidase (beta-lactamase class C family)